MATPRVLMSPLGSDAVPGEPSLDWVRRPPRVPHGVPGAEEASLLLHRMYPVGIGRPSRCRAFGTSPVTTHDGHPFLCRGIIYLLQVK